jgi:MFS family permease
MGIYLLIFMGGTPLGAPLIGWLAESIGIRMAVFLCGVVVFLASAVLLVILRRAPGPEPITDSIPVIPEQIN